MLKSEFTSGFDKNITKENKIRIDKNIIKRRGKYYLNKDRKKILILTNEKVFIILPNIEKDNIKNFHSIKIEVSSISNKSFILNYKDNYSVMLKRGKKTKIIYYENIWYFI